MPCQSYETNWAHDYDDTKLRKLKAEADKLARIACKAMTELEKMGKEDFLLLRDNEIREWWEAHKEADRREQARLAEIERRERIKSEALARLSDEEQELLGLKKPAPKSKKKTTIKNSTLVPTQWVDDTYPEETISDLVKAFNDLTHKKF